jgi:hypothetical protein
VPADAEPAQRPVRVPADAEPAQRPVRVPADDTQPWIGLIQPAEAQGERR